MRILATTVLAAAIASECYKCINGLYDEDCLTESLSCTEDQLCMTEFRQENGQVRITKGCKQKQACEVQASTNKTLCYEYPYVRVCHSCCEGDLCNDDMELPPFRKVGTCGKPAIKPLIGNGRLLDKLRSSFGVPQRRFPIASRGRRSVSSEKLHYNPVASWGMTTTNLGKGFDLLPVIKTAMEEETKHNETTVDEETGLTMEQIGEMSDVNLKIAAGRPSVPGSWAWVAQIKYWRNGRYEFVCAGTLIADRWILTAAQCLSDDESGEYDVTNMVVVLGVEYNEFVHPACLPYGRYTSEYSAVEAEANLVEDADYCWFVGWGFTKPIPNYEQKKPNDLARVLQQSRHYLMEHQTCDNILDTWNIDKKEHLCAVGYETAPGFIGHACEGDGGGPLVCRHKDNSWFIAGIEIGQSSHCGQSPYERLPSIFSRVSVFENWINKVIFSPVAVPVVEKSSLIANGTAAL
ncbi:Oidioi.mRNA.OKI2018_I69.chr2.g7803.t1.cds [Oikopleura dioica]|uniref:Oidioi.mRNA.OKI2018_I69.chr2.g7803.t1.cds n=1 Tax=Oikopleura dioica TaxID=34765 RepID=A0ABN7TDR5_OIKDI|nr:Oidioi.mRNA.OKI2018_I69.chr2.g7803.t1.cds [Oikopleura dioica]